MLSVSAWIDNLRQLIDNGDEATEHEKTAIAQLIAQTPTLSSVVQQFGFQETVRQGINQLYPELRNLFKGNLDDESSDVDVYVISHANIDIHEDPLLFSTMTVLKDLILYNPWGSSIDKNIVAGIVSKNITPTDTVISNAKNPVKTWNSFSKSSLRFAPFVTLEQLERDHTGYEGLRQRGILHSSPNKLVLVMVQEANATEGPIKIPLWLMALMCGITGRAFRKQVTYHHCGCLQWTEDNQLCAVLEKCSDQYHCCQWPFPKPIMSTIDEEDMDTSSPASF